MIKKIFLLIIFFATLFVFGSAPPLTNAQDCESISCDESSDDYSQCLNGKISCIENRLGELSSQKTTLNGVISVFNGNINIQELQIQQTIGQINKLEKEIESLSNRISGLSISLDRLTTLLIDRIRTQYKQKQTNPLVVLITSDSLNKFVNQYRYLSLAGKQTAEAMQRAQHQRIFYDEQKDEKTIKQDQIETKRYQLQLEQNNLVAQRKEKKNLLATTENDEQKFQKLLKEAQEQVASLRSYTTSKGGASLLSGMTKCDDWGCYYNQRDSQWGSQSIGKSNETMAEVGCLVASVAMVASHHGRSLTPAQVAASSNPFFYNTANMLHQWSGSVNGVTVSRSRRYGSSSLDSELALGNPVIVKISAGNSVGTHFIVITKKEDGKYMMKDPYEIDGNDIPFTSKHSLSQILAVDRVAVY